MVNVNGSGLRMRVSLAFYILCLSEVKVNAVTSSICKCSRLVNLTYQKEINVDGNISDKFINFEKSKY